MPLPAFLVPSHCQEVTSQTFFVLTAQPSLPLPPPTPRAPCPLGDWTRPCSRRPWLPQPFCSPLACSSLGLLPGPPPAHQSCPSPPAVTSPALPPRTLTPCPSPVFLQPGPAQHPPPQFLAPFQCHPCPLLQPPEPHPVSLFSVLCPLVLSPLSSLPLLLSSVPPILSHIPNVQPSVLCLQLQIPQS